MVHRKQESLDPHFDISPFEDDTYFDNLFHLFHKQLVWSMDRQDWACIL